MRFECPNCATRYKVADEKLGASGCRVRCRRCERMISVSPSGEVACDEADPQEETKVVAGDDSPFGTAGTESGFRAGGSAAELSDDRTVVATPPDPVDIAGPTGSISVASGDIEPAPAKTRVQAMPDFATDENPGEAPSMPSQDIDARLDGMERDELADMESALQDEIESISRDIAWPGSKDVSPEIPDPDLSGLGQLAQESDGADADFRGEGTDSAGQIGNAFEAMFGAAPSEDINPADARSEAMAEGMVVQEDADGWFVAVEDEQVGPVDVEAVKALYSARRIELSSLCWRQGMPDWGPVRETELADVLASVERNDSDEDVPPDPSLAHLQLAPAAPPSDSVGGTEADEASWRPSAASALASLAAEELGEGATDASPGAARDEPGPVLSRPRTTDLLEKLVEGHEDSAPSKAFGAGERSATRVGALPEPAASIRQVPIGGPSEDGRLVRGAIVGAAISALLVGLGVFAWTRTGGEGPSATAEAQVERAPAPTPAVPKATKTAVVKPPSAAPPAAPTPKPVEEAKSPVAATPKAEVKPPSPPAAPKKLRPAAEKKRTALATKSPGTAQREARKPKPQPRRAPPQRPRATRKIPRGEADDEALLGDFGRRRRRVEPAADPGLPRQLDDTDVLSVMRRNGGDVKRCLEAHEATGQGPHGRMEVRFVIRRNGETKRVVVGPSKFRSSGIGKCMVGSVSKWRFPRFTGDPMPIDFPVHVP